MSRRTRTLATIKQQAAPTESYSRRTRREKEDEGQAMRMLETYYF